MSVNMSAAWRDLGAELSKLREAQPDGPSQRAMAAQLGINHSTLSNWEAGRRAIKSEDLIRLLDHYGTAGDDRERVLGRWRKAYEIAGEIVPSGRASLDQLIEQERSARRITTVSPLLLPGLLQISGYARAILRNADDAEKLIALRMGRADILRGREPVELHAFIASSILTRHLAAREVMIDQLVHLLEMSRRPNITIQLVPDQEAEYSPLLGGPFILMEFPSAGPMVHLEHYATALSLWDPAEVRRFQVGVERVAGKALTAARSVEVIEELVDGLEQTK